MKHMRWPFSIRRHSEVAIGDLPDDMPFVEKIGELLTPNMRALRLTMTIADYMLSMGVPASRVVSRSLDITETYCKSPVHIDVSSTIIMLSQLRGIDKEPLTLIRPVNPREINNMTLELVQELVEEIKEGKLGIKKAEEKLDEILKSPIVYPGWMITAGNASIAAGVSMLFSSNWRIWITTFVIAVLVDRLLRWLAHHGITSFFRQICAALFVTLAAALINQLTIAEVAFFAGMNPTLIVVGGIIMLVAGLMIVGAIQDAIEEYYITANARILKVALLTMGIVLGILIGLYLAQKLGMKIYVAPDKLKLNDLGFQVLGSAIAAAGYALSTQTRLRAILWAGIIGAGALFTMYWATQLDISTVVGSGVAAGIVGLAATLFSRSWKTPSVGIVTAGILPLVPGLALMIGLMQLGEYPPSDPRFMDGVTTLFTALSTALAIAVGATFGSMLGRPLHHQATNRRNSLPFKSFMHVQIQQGHRSRFARLLPFHLWASRDIERTRHHDDSDMAV